MFRRAAVRLDCALQAGDVEGVIGCVDPECEIELLGVPLRTGSTRAGKNHIVEEGRNLGHQFVTRR